MRTRLYVNDPQRYAVGLPWCRICGALKTWRGGRSEELADYWARKVRYRVTQNSTVGPYVMMDVAGLNSSIFEHLTIGTSYWSCESIRDNWMNECEELERGAPAER